MFKNIVKELKLAANIVFYFVLALSVILGIVMFSYALVLEGILYILVGGFGAYLLSLLIRGFVMIIENTNTLKSYDAYKDLDDEELKNKYLSGELDGNVYLRLLEEKKNNK